jgi:hypothetical protein
MKISTNTQVISLEILPSLHDAYSKAEFCLYLPSNGPVRGIALLLPGLNAPGANLVGSQEWLEFAEKCRFGLLACTFKQRPEASVFYFQAERSGAGSAIASALSEFEFLSRQKDFRRLPLVVWGHSAGGQLAFHLACWNPSQIIAYVVVKGGFYFASGMRNPEVTEIPALFIVGQQDEVYRRQATFHLYAEHRRENANWFLWNAPGRHEIGCSNRWSIPFLTSCVASRLTESKINPLPDDSLEFVHLKTARVVNPGVHKAIQGDPEFGLLPKGLHASVFLGSH